MPGRRWTPEEDRQLREMLKEGLKADLIAAQLDRRQRSEIYSRVQRLDRKRRKRSFEPEPLTKMARAPRFPYP
jgi:hypothetical protein